MAVTVEQVYNIALSLIDSVDETGNYSADNPDEAIRKTLDFLTTLQVELTSIDQTPQILTDLNNVLTVSDRVALLVLPYGLAAHLLIQEDPNSASFFNSRYDELKVKIPSSVESITDQYDVLSGMC